MAHVEPPGSRGSPSPPLLGRAKRVRVDRDITTMRRRRGNAEKHREPDQATPRPSWRNYLGLRSRETARAAGETGPRRVDHQSRRCDRDRDEREEGACRGCPACHCGYASVPDALGGCHQAPHPFVQEDRQGAEALLNVLVVHYHGYKTKSFQVVLVFSDKPLVRWQNLPWPFARLHNCSPHQIISTLQQSARNNCLRNSDRQEERGRTLAVAFGLFGRSAAHELRDARNRTELPFHRLSGGYIRKEDSTGAVSAGRRSSARVVRRPTTRLRPNWLARTMVRRKSTPAAKSRKLPGHPPPALPARRYSRFQVAAHASAKASARGRSGSKDVSRESRAGRRSSYHPRAPISQRDAAFFGKRNSPNCKAS